MGLLVKSRDNNGTIRAEPDVMFGALLGSKVLSALITVDLVRG